MICHKGSSFETGHYISFILLNEESYECDDKTIKPVDFEQIKKISETSGYDFFYLKNQADFDVHNLSSDFSQIQIDGEEENQIEVSVCTYT